MELKALRERVEALEAQATTVAPATTTTVVPAQQFDSVDWHSFYDWCLDHRGYRGVDCDELADDLQEWVNKYPEFKDCGLKAAKWRAVTNTVEINTRITRNVYYMKLRACRGVEEPSPVATTAAPAATTAAP